MLQTNSLHSAFDRDGLAISKMLARFGKHLKTSIVAPHCLAPTATLSLSADASTSSSGTIDATIEASSSDEKAIAAKLAAAFGSAKKIVVQDTSGGCGAMYNIEVIAGDFK
jgi:hypothetical protein